ncbi:B-cell scaffold protein with ankyrin repeats-like [Polyodon spathula]|uniref:B-cell scaffold protein with ankyrin repeats-like n=1 Tax=Polyodon spathula TaxID=7913 RepID=UPI001B7E3CCF|nr:B-cell scaffold protein with ankyrin repeats-like [Polyodon spathula]
MVVADDCNDLVIIYEEEAEQWATYLKYVFLEKIKVQNMCCYDIGMASIKNEDFVKFSLYKCKLLILSKGMLDMMCQIRRFFLSRVLQPPQTVVILQCGVSSSGKLFELVPLGSECLEISSEQDPKEYLATVTGIIYKGAQAASNFNARTAGLEFKIEKKHSVGALPVKSPILVIPTRIPCEKPEDIFLLLQDALNPKDIEIEFQANNQKVRVKPTPWNEKTLCVKALDFPAGTINVNIYCRGVITTKTEIQYYTAMGEIEHLLKKAADPIDFMCQAFQISSTDKLDQLLTSCLKDRMPAGGLGVLQIDGSNKSIQHSDELPTLLHFAAKNGLKNLAAQLLRCPGAQQAARMTNKHRESPVTLAEKHGHTDLQKLIEEILWDDSLRGWLIGNNGYPLKRWPLTVLLDCTTLIEKRGFQNAICSLS